jgi:hypothetical protein
MKRILFYVWLTIWSLVSTAAFLLIAAPGWATEVLVIGTAANITGHEVGMRNTILSESGLDAANVKICYTGSSDAEGHDPDIHIRVTGAWPTACIDYAAANGFELVSVSYTGFSSTIDEDIADAFRSSDIGAVYATTADVTNPTQFYTTTPGQENPDDTAGSIDSNYLEFRTYDTGSLSSATARTAGIIAYLMENAAFNYWDARGAIRENSSQWNTWDKNIGFGYVDITTAKAESNTSLLVLQPPIVRSVEIMYTDSANIVITFEHFHQTRWDSTKFVYFTSEPAPTAAPGDADGEICDITNAATTTCTWSDILPGTYYIVGYTEETTNYSTIQDEFLSSAITVVTQTPMPITGGLQFYDANDNTWTEYASIADLDAVENPTNGDIIDCGGGLVSFIEKTTWDSSSPDSPITLQNCVTGNTTRPAGVITGDNWNIKNIIVTNAPRGIRLSGGGVYNIENVVASQTSSDGIEVQYMSTINIKNAILSDTAANIDCGISGATCTVSNSIYGSTSGGGSTIIDGGGNIIGVDPLFINPTTGDFRLKQNSPAIRTGTGTLWNGIPCSIGAIQQTKGVVGSSTFFGNYKLGDAKNECTIE